MKTPVEDGDPNRSKKADELAGSLKDCVVGKESSQPVLKIQRLETACAVCMPT